MPRSKAEIISDMVDAGMTDDEIRNAVKPSAPPEPSVLKRGWEALRLPEQMATQVLSPEKPMTSLPPQISPSVAGTLASGTPQVMEQSAHDIGSFLKKISPQTPQSGPVSKAEGFVKDILPSLVSRGAILTSGALEGIQQAAPALKAFMEAGGSQLESVSGAKKGMLATAFDKATNGKLLQLAPGKKIASPFYEAAKAELPAVLKEAAGLNPIADIPENKKIFETAVDVLKNGGSLEPSEALTARKAADTMYDSKTYSKDIVDKWKKVFDSIAKQSPNIAKADPLHKEGLLAESSRQLIPQNKYGGASAWKIGIGSTLTGIGTAVGHALGAPLEGSAVGAALGSAALSPAMQGAVATGAGLASKALAPLVNNPTLSGSVLSAVVKTLTKDKAKEYLKKAENDPVLARKMAQDDGWKIPKKK